MTNFRFQLFILLSGLGIAASKFGLYIWTQSNGIFSDALESLVNISANSITLYSLYLAAKPRDKSHPYGHGKVEFLAAGIEGTLLFIAGVFTIHKSIIDYLHATPIHLTGTPLVAVLVLGFANYILGVLSENRGIKQNSPALISGGQHLKADGYTTFAILLSLVIMYFSQWIWIDTFIAIMVGLFIIYQGFKVVKRSVLDILDTADEDMLSNIIDFIQKNRDKHWVDIHNFRILKFGSEYHVDAHLTLPYFYSNTEVHREMKEVHDLINMHFNSTVEIFIHPDPCEPFCCQFCQNDECNVRQKPFEKEIIWTLDNVIKDEKHGVYVE